MINQEEEEAFVVKKIEEEEKWKKNRKGKVTNNSRILSLKTNKSTMSNNKKLTSIETNNNFKILFFNKPKEEVETLPLHNFQPKYLMSLL